MEIGGYTLVALGWVCFAVFLVRPVTSPGSFLGLEFRGVFLLLLSSFVIIFGEGFGPVIGIFSAAYLLSMLAVPLILIKGWLTTAVLTCYGVVTLLGIVVSVFAVVGDEENKAYRDMALVPISVVLVTIGLWCLI